MPAHVVQRRRNRPADPPADPLRPAAVATLDRDHLPKLPSGDGRVLPFAPACATFRRHLRESGLKFTPERAAVLDVVLREPALFDAERVADEIKRQGHRGSRATVYRTLGHLQEAGLLRQVIFGPGQGFFEVDTGSRASDYVIDVETGEILPVQSDELRRAREAVCRELGVEAVRHQCHIFVRRLKLAGR